MSKTCIGFPGAQLSDNYEMDGNHPRSPIAFAHRGGKADFRANTLDAFRHAIDVGLTAVETDAWLTADGQVVLDHDGKIRSFFRLHNRPIAAFKRSELPKHIPTLAELCDLVGPGVDIQIDVKGENVARQVVEVARQHRPNAMNKLWLAHSGYKKSEWQLAAQWRELDADIHLVDSTSVRRFDLPADGYAERAARAGIDVINLSAREWYPELIAAVHRHGLLCFGFNAQKPALIASLIAMGIDGVYSDHVDRLVDALQARDA